MVEQESDRYSLTIKAETKKKLQILKAKLSLEFKVDYTYDDVINHLIDVFDGSADQDGKK